MLNGSRNSPLPRLPSYTGLAQTKRFDFSKRSTAALRKSPEQFDVAWLRQVTPAYTWNWPYLDTIREHLNRIERGMCKRLAIFIPPRHGKSQLATIRFPVYCLERNPKRRVIVGAYNQTLAEEFSRQARRIARERIALSAERVTANDWQTAAGGGLRAAGVGGGVTGHGADLIIIDDPVKSREEANSLAYRERVWDWYREDMYTRLEPGGAMVLIQTRWHEDDLAGRILASEQAGGGMFKREWFQIVDVAPVEARRVRYWDKAGTEGDGARSCGVRMAQTADGLIYVEDVVKGQWSSFHRNRVMLQTAELDGARVAIWTEQEPGSGGKESAEITVQLLGGFDVHAETVSGDKETRAYPFADQCEAGNVYLVKGAWNAQYIDELATFPSGQYKDQVDGSSGAYNKLALDRSMSLLEYYRRKQQAGGGK